ncbi:hypothetical protein HYV73_04885 [Candidatus Uhrbacteria bacterium]|nr:hypothetical protein [Candidatus Uhrbacteria bacterium]
MNITRPHRLFPLLLILTVGIISTNLTGVYADQSLRDDLLERSNIAAAALDREDIMKLTGTEADIGTLPYDATKRRMTRIKDAATGASFAYLFGKHGDDIIFLVDNEPPESEDYSPPGQVYTDATQENYIAFETGIPYVEGPLKDDWGVWVTGLVPIHDLKTGKVMAVFGLDIAAEYWKKELWSRQNVPLFIMGFGIAFLLLFFRHQDKHRSLRAVIRDLKMRILQLGKKYGEDIGEL